MFDVLKRVIGKNKTKRCYLVPDGLAGRICELKDQASKGSWVAHRELWGLVEARCPEVKRGNWKINRDGSRLLLQEVSE